MFDYHLKQPDAQTSKRAAPTPQGFDYHLKQPDAQTSELMERIQTLLKSANNRQLELICRVIQAILK